MEDAVPISEQKCYWENHVFNNNMLWKNCSSIFAITSLFSCFTHYWIILYTNLKGMHFQMFVYTYMVIYHLREKETWLDYSSTIFIEREEEEDVLTLRQSSSVVSYNVLSEIAQSVVMKMDEIHTWWWCVPPLSKIRHYLIIQKEEGPITENCCKLSFWQEKAVHNLTHWVVDHQSVDSHGF